MKDYDDDLSALDRRVRASLTRRYPADVRINYRVDRLQEPDTTNANVVFMRGEGPLPVSQGRPSRRRPRSVAALEIEQEKRFSLKLLGEDDKPVRVGDPEQPVQYVGRLAFSDSQDAHDDYIRKVDIHNSIAITVPPLPLVLGHRYAWSLEVDGEPMSSVAFVVRPDDEDALDTADQPPGPASTGG